MRWIQPCDEATKIIKKFAILPIMIDGEIRWLERVTIEYTYTYGRDGGGPRWFATKFVDRGPITNEEIERRRNSIKS